MGSAGWREEDKNMLAAFILIMTLMWSVRTTCYVSVTGDRDERMETVGIMISDKYNKDLDVRAVQGHNVSSRNNR